MFQMCITLRIEGKAKIWSEKNMRENRSLIARRENCETALKLEFQQPVGDMSLALKINEI